MARAPKFSNPSREEITEHQQMDSRFAPSARRSGGGIPVPGRGRKPLCILRHTILGRSSILRGSGNANDRENYSKL